MQLLRWRCELHAVALREAALCLSVNGDALQAAGIVTDFLSVLARNCDLILFLVHVRNPRVLSRLDVEPLTAFRVTHDVALFVLVAHARSAPVISCRASSTFTLCSSWPTAPRSCISAWISSLSARRDSLSGEITSVPSGWRAYCSAMAVSRASRSSI